MRLVLPLSFMLSYDEALDYLNSFIDYSVVRADKYSPQTFGLGRMVNFLAALGNPQQRYPALHVAGTKGKGSVAAMSASALQAGGYRTGFYTSPHLLDFRERAQVDGQFIVRAAVAEIVDQLRSVEPQFPGLSHFELTTALAFLYFAREQVDVAVVEVGLGGRLDATNVVTPRVSVISSLSYDHTYLLGNTLAEIAGEKGGIIKPGVPVVSAPQKPEALGVLERLAAERHAPLTVVGRDWLYHLVAHDLTGQEFEVWSAAEQAQLDGLRAQGHPVDWRPEQLRIPLLGRHQGENAVVAYAALQALRDQGLPLSPEAIRAGLRSVRWPGRFEIVSRRPYLVLDGAHNRDSAQKLTTTLQDYFPGRRVTLIFGASSDKDVSGMLAELLGPGTGITRVILTQAVHPRAQDPEELVNMVIALGVSPEVVSSVGHAVRLALASAKPDDVILACGSLFVVAEASAAARTGELVSD
jgi:dihydrofolate synthase / folylpolyglutamate synthase